MIACLAREFRLYYAKLTDLFTVFTFFALVCAIFPFGLGSERALLQAAGPGIVWIVALLAMLISLESMLKQDKQNGSLDQLRLLPVSSMVVLSAKWLAHWLCIGVPLILLAPVLGLLYGLDGTTLQLIMLSLLLGTPCLSALGLAAAALSLEARQAQIMLPLLVLPLSTPIIIFALGALKASVDGLPAQTPWLVLTALPFIYLPLCLLAAQIAIEQE